MRPNIKILTFFLILSSTCYGQENVNTNSISKYDFTLEINEHFLASNNRVLSKYFVNKVSGTIFIDSMQMLNPERLYFIEYASDSTIEKQIDFSISDKEKDSLFVIVKDLFKISDPIGIRTNEPDFSEGKYTVIRLNLDNYNSRYIISINLENESINRRKYRMLLNYLNKLKTAYNNGYRQ